MTYDVIVNNDGTTTLRINFTDEGINLQGETRVKGDEAIALSYLPVFETDLRRNFADLFPVPESPIHEEGR